MSSVFIVVGDSYAKFTQHSGVISLSEMLERLNAADRWTGAERIVIGQGIGNGALDRLLAALQLRGIQDIVHAGVPATTELTHKHHPEFSLITEPRRLSEKAYSFQLVCGEEIDRLSDHVTGQHLSAMLLLEAARQAIIASVELAYPPPADKKYGMVVEQYSSIFNTYAFPIPTLIHVLVQEHERNEQQARLSPVASFFQAGKQICEMTIHGSIYEQSLLNVVETRRARRAVNALYARHAMSSERQVA